jgi:hypothetical protein
MVKQAAEQEGGEDRSKILAGKFRRPYMYPKQEDAIFTEARFAWIEASTKAQPLDAVVYTPSGPRTMGDLDVGDEVIGAAGSAVSVTAVHEHGVQPTYRVTFSDGTSTEAAAGHHWLIEHYARPARSISTKRLSLWSPSTLRQWRVPVVQNPIEFEAAGQLLIDPWLLGFLLGDGSLARNVIGFSTADHEWVVAKVKDRLPHGYSVVRTAEHSYNIKVTNQYAGRVGRRPDAGIRLRKIGGYAGFETSIGSDYIGMFASKDEALVARATAIEEKYGDAVPAVSLKATLAELGLLGVLHDNKFIPSVYKYANIEARRELIRGLVDSDGSVPRSGNRFVVHQTSERLANDIQEVIESLGGTCRISQQQARQTEWKDSYICRIAHPELLDLVTLPRKRERFSGQGGAARHFRSVEYVGEKEVRCISIDDPNHLYLTDHCIVTENSGKTVGCMAWLLEQAIEKGGANRNFWWIAPSRAQSLDVYERMKAGLPRRIYRKNDTDRKVMLINGSVIWFKTGEEPNLLYGAEVYAAVIDEASRVREDAWVAIQSTLSATNGPVRCIGNVKGKKNWFYRYSRRAQAGGEPNAHYGKMTCADAIEAGIMDPQVVEDARQHMPEAFFRELYFAEAADDEGNPFGSDAIRDCIKKFESVYGSAKVSGKPAIAWGWDVARTVDYTVGIGLDEDCAVAEFRRWRGVPWLAQAHRVRVLSGSVPTLVDSTGVGDPFLEMLWRTEGGQLVINNFEGIKLTVERKQQVIEGLVGAIQGRSISYPDGPIAIELDSFEYQYPESASARARGLVLYAAPEGMYDDCVIALALARKKWLEASMGGNVQIYTATSLGLYDEEL